MEERANRKGIILVLGLALACASFDLLVYFRPELWNHNSEYQWRVLEHGRKAMLVPVFLLWSALVSAGLWGFRRAAKRLSGRKLDALAAGLIFMLGILSPLVFFKIDRFGDYELLVRIFVEDHTGYFSDAMKFRTRAGLNKAFRENLASLSSHGRTHPPADALLFMGLNRLAESSGAVQGLYKMVVKDEVRRQIQEHFGTAIAGQAAGMAALLMMLLAGGLSAVLGYFLGRRFSSPELGFISMLALVSLPAFSAKTPVMDQVYAVFILAAVLVALTHEKGRLWPGLIAGFIIGAGAWLSPSVWSAVFLIPLVLMARDLAAEPRKKFREIYESLLVLGLSGFMAAGFALWLGSLATKINYIDIFQLNRSGWFLNNTASGRISAWKWLLFNPYEYFFWASLPIFLGCALQCYSAKRFAEQQARCAGRRRVAAKHELGKSFIRIKNSWPNISRTEGFFAAAFVFALLLNLSGQICYESPRLCWFFLPILANFGIAGFADFAQSLHRKIWYLVLTLVSLQTSILIAIY